MEYIEREAAYTLAKKIVDAVHSGEYSSIQLPHFILDAIDDIPAADVRPVVRGKWQFHMFTANSWGYECRVCHTTWDAPTNFCPNCGAMMEES